MGEFLVVQYFNLFGIGLTGSYNFVPNGRHQPEGGLKREDQEECCEWRQPTTRHVFASL